MARIATTATPSRHRARPLVVVGLVAGVALLTATRSSSRGMGRVRDAVMADSSQAG